MSDGINDCSGDEYRYKSDRKPVPSGTQDEREKDIRWRVDRDKIPYLEDMRYLLSLLDAERKRVQELERALTGSYEILKALDISVKWELAPTIKQTIKEWCQQAESILPKEQTK